MDLVRDGDKHRALLEELNRDAQEIANDVNELLSSLGAKMNEMSGSVVDHVDLLAETIDNWMQVLRATAQQTNQWLDELEGLDREMEPIQLLAAKIGEIKKSLQTLESL